MFYENGSAREKISDHGRSDNNGGGRHQSHYINRRIQNDTLMDRLKIITKRSLKDAKCENGLKVCQSERRSVCYCGCGDIVDVTEQGEIFQPQTIKYSLSLKGGGADLRRLYKCTNMQSCKKIEK